MRKLLTVISLFFLVKVVMASTQVTFTWTESSLATVPACTSATPALTSNCISGFNIYNVSASGTRTKISNLPITDAPSATTVFTLVIPNYPYLGSDNAIATCLYIDQNGNAGETAGSLPSSFLFTPADPSLKNSVP